MFVHFKIEASAARSVLFSRGTLFQRNRPNGFSPGHEIHKLNYHSLNYPTIWWGWRFRFGVWFMLHVSGLCFVNARGVVGEDPFNLTFSDYRWRTRANFGNWDWWGANADSDPWRGGWGRREGVTRNEVHGACGGTCRLAWSPRGATIPHHASREPISLQVPTLILPW